MNYQIKADIDLSRIPISKIAKIMKDTENSIAPVIKAQFPKESKKFELYIDQFTYNSLGWNLRSNQPEIFKKGMDFIHNAITNDIAKLPKQSYGAFCNLGNFAIEVGGVFAVYNGEAQVPLFEFSEKNPIPRPPPITRITEELITIGQILEFTGLGEWVTIHIRLLDKQDLYVKVPKSDAIKLRKGLYEYVKIFGKFQREANSYQFIDYDIERIQFEANGELTRKVFQEMTAYPKKTEVA